MLPSIHYSPVVLDSPNEAHQSEPNLSSLQIADNKTTHHQGPINGNHPLETTIKNAAELRSVLAKFGADQANGKKIAVVSGGSLSGYAVALKLKNKGYNVIISEKRKEYSRQNVITLREEALYSLANLSPNGHLIKSLLEQKLITPYENRVTQDAGSEKWTAKESSRLMKWLVGDNQQSEVYIPQRQKTDAPVKEALAHLDLAWPKSEVVEPIKAKDWRYTDLTKMAKTI